LNTTEVLFVGIAQKCPMAGRKVTLKCSPALDVLGAEAPAFTLQAALQLSRVWGGLRAESGVV
jgi:hypothetical protein